MRRFLVLLALFSFSHIAAAAEVRLGTEVPLGKPAFAPPPDAQQILSVVTNGRDYLALWSDARQTLPTDPNPAAALYIGRLDAAGHPANPTGHKLFDRATGQLVFTGTTYLLVYTLPNGHSFLQALDPDGNFAGLGVEILLSGPVLRAASNGRNIAILNSSSQSDSAVLSLFNFSGMLVRSNVMLPLFQPASLFLLPNGDYGVVATHFICPGNNVPCYISTTLLTMNGTSGETTERELVELAQWPAVAANASSDGHILLSWMQERQEGRTAYYELLDAAGNVVAGPVRIAAEPLRSISGYHRPSVGWDGREFLVTLNWPSADESTSELLAYRVSASGQLLDTTPIDLGVRPVNAPQFATGAAGTLVAWDAAPQVAADVYDRAVGSFDALASAQTNPIAESAVRQILPRLAPGWSPYAIWREGNEAENLTGSIVGGAPSVIAPPQPFTSPFPAPQNGAVARGRDSFLVVWRDGTPATAGYSILAKRVAFNGTPIDTTPIVVASDSQTYYNAWSSDNVAVGSDGTNFLVVWDDQPGLLAMRISPEGKLLDAQPFRIDRSPYGYFNAEPRIVWTGSRYLIAWYDVRWSPTLVSPPIPPSAELRLGSVSAAGEVLDGGATPQIGNTNTGGDLALASSGNGALLIFTETRQSQQQACGYSVPLRSDGTPAASIRQLQCGVVYPQQSFVSPDVAWDGREYVAVWSDPTATSIDALRFDVAGNPIDAAPFTVSPAGTRAVQPAVAASAAGATIAYVRVADEAPFGGVARVFARTLERIGSLGRTRVAR